MDMAGGITYTRLGSSDVRLLTSLTGMLVTRPRISVSMLAWVGSRCWTMTKAMPVSVAISRNMRRSASRPPADAPTPTTGNARLSCAGGSLAGGGGASRARVRGLLLRRVLDLRAMREKSSRPEH
jgi:hypothetical protein